ncbi:MAG: hypothetical protein IJ529_05260, partial [Alphaproteobacteria bacterium]|nr:hypothetical protein [Alphaproteobacteria bacterium]
QAPEYAAPMSEYVTPVPDRSFDVIDAFAQTEPPAEPLDDFNNWVAETADDNTPPIDQSFTFQDEPLPANDVAAKEPSEVAAKTPATPPETEKNFWLDDEPSSVSPMVDDEPKDYFNLSELSGEDWGFGNNSASSETMDVLPDVADAPLSSDDGYEYAEVEMIGEGSNIYTTDSAAEQGGDWAPIIAHPRSISITRPPQIFDDATDDADPYVK